MRITLIDLYGESNRDNPIRVKLRSDSEQTLYKVSHEKFRLFTEGETTGRHQFSICRGTWEVYEVHTDDGQKNVIVSRVW
jgi:hypothetical protein